MKGTKERAKEREEDSQAMITLAAGGDVEGVREALEDGLSPNFIQQEGIQHGEGIYGESGGVFQYGSDTVTKCALTEAAKYGHTDVISLLLDGGANIDQVVTSLPGNVSGRSTQRDTALSLAVRNGHEDAATVLIDRGANVNFVSKTRISFGASVGMHEKKPVLHLAIEKGCSGDLVTNLLQHGAKPNKLADYDTPAGVDCFCYILACVFCFPCCVICPGITVFLTQHHKLTAPLAARRFRNKEATTALGKFKGQSSTSDHRDSGFFNNKESNNDSEEEENEEEGASVNFNAD